MNKLDQVMKAIEDGHHCNMDKWTDCVAGITVQMFGTEEEKEMIIQARKDGFTDTEKGFNYIAHLASELFGLKPWSGLSGIPVLFDCKTIEEAKEIVASMPKGAKVCT